MSSLWMDVDTALIEIPVNVNPLVDAATAKVVDEGVVFNEAGLDLVWHFTNTAGVSSATPVTPTSGGDYNWQHQDAGMYTIAMTASGGASANNDTEGFGYFTGNSTENLPWRGPTIGFRAAAINDLLIDAPTALTNLTAQYDGTGLVGDTFPLRQDQGASISGGLAVHETATSVTVIQGEEQGLADTGASNNTRWTGDDVGAGAEFIFRFVPSDTDSNPGDLHFEGFYAEPGAPFTNSATVETYNFQLGQWDVQETLTNSSEDETHDDQLSNSYRSPNSDTIETVAVTPGDVLVKFQQTSQETGEAVLNIDKITVGFISSPLTASEIQSGLATSAEVATVGLITNLVRQDTVEILLDTDELVTNQGSWATATSVTVSNKTGFKLASDGLDSISTTEPAGVASNFREMLVQTWRRFFKKATMTSTQIKTYDDAGTGVVTTQTVSDDGTTQTQGEAS